MKYITIIKIELIIICLAIWYLWLPLIPFFEYVYPQHANYIRIGYYVLFYLILSVLVWILSHQLEKEWIAPKKLSWMVDYLYPEENE